MTKRLLIIILIAAGFSIPAHPALAETKGETLTKGEAIMLISASDFMKKKIGELVSWTVGFDISKVNRVRLTPTINYVLALPRKVPPDGRTILEIQASVDDPGGLMNIAGVRADLSTIGRLPNTMLVDNGLFGDQKANDGVFTLQTSVPKVPQGTKDIAVAVANRKGWLALAKTSLEIRKNPVIAEARCLPDRGLADGRSLITITVKVDNPGRIEDLESVTADLRQLGLPEKLRLRNDGQGGDAVPGDDVFTLQFTLPGAAAPGIYLLPVQAVNLIGGLGVGEAAFSVYK